MRILKSSEEERSRTYFVSRRIQSWNEVLLRPATWSRPVTPGQTLSPLQGRRRSSRVPRRRRAQRPTCGGRQLRDEGAVPVCLSRMPVTSGG